MGKEKSSGGAVPKNWPAGLTYLSQPAHAAHLTREQVQAVRTRPAGLEPGDVIPAGLARGPSAAVRIVSIPAAHATHPARGQAGLFAARALAPGTLVVPYLGVAHAGGHPDHARSDYDLWLDRDAGIAVDAAGAGNEARFVNDYRGVRPRPNAEFRECWDPRVGERCMAVFVLPAGKRAAAAAAKGGKKGAAAAAAVAGIAKGEEICVSYGKGFWGRRQAEEEEEGEWQGEGEGEANETQTQGDSQNSLG